ncbi:MAG: hypothetical protein V4733_08030 [Verrucomicrobiota bacterium]
MESFSRESFIYLLVGGSFQAVGALIVALFFFPIARRLTSASWGQLVSAYFVFNAFLLIWGCLGHYAFLAATYGKLYVSMDRVVDWLPFIPFGPWVLDQTLHGPRGYLIGDASLWQLRLIWTAVAIPVWLLAYASTHLALRSLRLTHATNVA